MTKHVAFHRTTQLNSTVTNHITHSILQAHVPDIPIKYMSLTSQQQNTEWCLHLSPALPLFTDVVTYSHVYRTRTRMFLWYSIAQRKCLANCLMIQSMTRLKRNQSFAYWMQLQSHCWGHMLKRKLCTKATSLVLSIFRQGSLWHPMKSVLWLRTNNILTCLPCKVQRSCFYTKYNCLYQTNEMQWK